MAAQQNAIVSPHSQRMARNKVFGTCHLCGADGELSYEHVPPRSAFNNRPVVRRRAEDLIEFGLAAHPRRGEILQRGAGGYTLCGRCNNTTGAWYGARFAAWCHQGMETLGRTGGRPSLVYLHYLFPLAIIKQVATMFFSVNNPRFWQKNEELQRFVLDKERKGLSPRYRFFMYYHLMSSSRNVGVAAWVDTSTGASKVLSELCFPPFGYVLSFGGGPPHPEMFEISHFATYGYNEFAVTEVRMPLLPTYLGFPGDYRTEEQIARDVEINSSFPSA